MNKFILFVATALTAATLVGAPPAAARGPGWKMGGGMPPGFAQGRKLGWASAGRPPGWSHGRKTGWHGAQVPPGFSRPQQTNSNLR